MSARRRSASFAVMLASLGLVTTAAQAEGSRFRNAMRYAEARETFRRLGYQPYFMPGAEICDPNDRRCYPELEACAKSRTWSCTYTWRRGRAIIEVETRYDDPVVAHSECIVNCSPAPRHHTAAAGKSAASRLD